MASCLNHNLYPLAAFCIIFVYVWAVYGRFLGDFLLAGWFAID
jgi:hypothetical protein